MNAFELDFFRSTGPVQFPDNPDSGQQEQQRSEQQQRIISHIHQNQALIQHPYAKLALNYRAQQLQRFNGNVIKAKSSPQSDTK